jgi:hypothetical protein
MDRIGRIRRVVVVAAMVLAGGVAPAVAQTLVTQNTTPMNLKATDKCPQPDIDQLQRVITFVQGQSWAEHPGTQGLRIVPDTAACRVTLQIGKVSGVEQAALEKGGEGRLSVEKTKDRAKPSKLPLLLWVIFGGAGVVFVFIRYGRR